VLPETFTCRHCGRVSRTIEVDDNGNAICTKCQGFVSPTPNPPPALPDGGLSAGTLYDDGSRSTATLPQPAPAPVDELRADDIRVATPNWMDVGVILEHIPTGLRSQCIAFASQHKNKVGALNGLRKLIAEQTATTSEPRAAAAPALAPVSHERASRELDLLDDHGEDMPERYRTAVEYLRRYIAMWKTAEGARDETVARVFEETHLLRADRDEWKRLADLATANEVAAKEREAELRAEVERLKAWHCEACGWNATCEHCVGENCGAEVAEAREREEYAVTRSKDLIAELEEIKAEREKYTRERVDIGNKYDLHMADCHRAAPAQPAVQVGAGMREIATGWWITTMGCMEDDVRCAYAALVALRDAPPCPACVSSIDDVEKLITDVAREARGAGDGVAVAKWKALPDYNRAVVLASLSAREEHPEATESTWSELQIVVEVLAELSAPVNAGEL
jgi:hypothetical protein